MNLLSVSGLGKSMRGKPLFSNITFGLEDGEKVGIVGRNGSGKSTLLKVLASRTAQDEGEYAYNGRVRLSYLEQNVHYQKDATIKSYLFEENSPEAEVMREYEKTKSLEMLERMNKDDLWRIERNYSGLLKEFSVTKDPDTRMDSLSGGEEKKVAIARTLAFDANLLFLDEPTNHLDIRTIEILEKKLQETKSAIIIVTHDRHILNTVANTIFELDSASFYRHKGTFESYLENREERRRMDERERERRENILRRELEWLKRGPKARTGKDKGRKERIENLLEEQKSFSPVKGNETFQSSSRRLGKKILELKGVSKGYGGKKLFSQFSFSFQKGMKIGLVGDNGSGKSTLMDLIAGIVIPDEGEVERGENTHISYFDQKGRRLKENEAILPFMKELGENVRYGGKVYGIERFLELFSFPSSMFFTPIGMLSGGERRRLELIYSIVQNPNMLILDEPTNDLDLETMENLEDYITSFDGVALITSHDRTFLDITVDTLLVIEEGKITQFPGSYSRWKEKRDEEKKSAEVKKDETRSETERPRREAKKGLTFREEREKKELEGKISEIEGEVKELEAYFSSGEYMEIEKKSKEYEEKKALLGNLEERYLELLEKEI